jgi:hypothetical protein
VGCKVLGGAGGFFFLFLYILGCTSTSKRLGEFLSVEPLNIVLVSWNCVSGLLCNVRNYDCKLRDTKLLSIVNDFI